MSIMDIERKTVYRERKVIDRFETLRRSEVRRFKREQGYSK